jgi:D-inositol-3-phosphate glycosyltransferase
MIEFWGSFNRYSLNLARALCELDVELSLVSVEDCIQESSIPYRLIRILPSFRSNTGLINKIYKYVRAYLSVLVFARRSNFDLIHFQYFRVIGLDWIFLWTAKLLGFKIIYTAHNILPHEKKLYHRFLFKFIYYLCDLIIPTSDFARNQLESQFHIKPDKIKTIPIGNTGPSELSIPSREEARNKLAIPSGQKLLLLFGAIREYKGIDAGIKAMSIVRDRIEDIKLLIVGPCSSEKLLSHYYSLIHALSVEDIVDIRPSFIDDKDVPVYMASSDIVILPYRKMSGHSAVLFLAYYFGKPVIATKVGGLGEAVEDGRSGYLIPANEEGQLANAIVKAFENSKQLVKMGEYGRSLNARMYSWEKIARMTFEAYSQIADINNP